MKIFIKIILTLIVTSLAAFQLVAQTKLAQTGFNFLSISSDARSSAMGDAVNSLTGFSGALSHNPASMADMPTLFSSSFSMNTWIADIKYLSASVIVSPFSGDYGVVGFSLQSVDYGDIEGTMVDRNNPNGYVDTKIFSPSAMAVGIGYATMLSEQFGIGAHIRYAFQSLGESTIFDGASSSVKENEVNAIAFDFGTVYKTGYKSLAFGMSVKNFSKEVKFEEEGFQLPLLFTIGISANVLDFFELSEINQGVILSIDATHPRSHPEQIKVGVEYQFMDIIFLRGGYVSGNDENDFNFGVGLSYFGFEVDYSYTPFGIFDNVQRFTARFSM